MHSAGDLEKYGYCPVSWWLSREERLWNEDTDRGTLSHDEASRSFHDVASEEGSARDLHFSFLLSILVMVNVTLVFLIFLPSVPLSSKRYMILGSSIGWMTLASIILIRLARDDGHWSRSFHDVAMTILGVVALLYSFNIIALIIMDSVPEWVYGFFALFWLALSILTAYLDRQQRRRSQEARGRMGLGGEVVYIGDESSELMLSRDGSLSGRPDLVLWQGDGYIPLELKTGRTPRGPLFSHILQLGAYCLLVSERYGRRVEKGIVRYPGQEFDIEYDEGLEALVREKLREMDALEASGEVRRNHQRRGKCQNCSRLDACPQALR